MRGGSSVSGFVGQAQGSTISNSYSTGNVTGERMRVGGLVGGAFYSSTISNSYSTGSVTGERRVGGLVGEASRYSTISNSYSTGSVTGDSDVGGLVGNARQSEVNNSYWNTQTSGIETSAGGEGRTTEQMTYPYCEETYVGWDFADIWGSDDDYWVNNGYPYLQ